MGQFNKEKDELLIELVKDNRPIFDVSDKNYKNHIVKHKCWEEISTIIGLPVLECKKRWKSLRDQYNKKKKDCGTGSARVNRSWEYGTLMSFLSDSQNDRRETITSVQPEDQAKQDNTQDHTQNNAQDDMQDDIREHTHQHSLDDTHEVLQENSQDQMQKTDGANEQHRQIQKPKKRKIDSPLDLLNKREAQRSFVYDKLLKRTPSPQTALKKFFESMVDIVENFPPLEQANIRLKVCQLVTETEIKLNAPQTQYVATPMSSDDSTSFTPQTQYVATPMPSDNSTSFAWL